MGLRMILCGLSYPFDQSCMFNLLLHSFHSSFRFMNIALFFYSLSVSPFLLYFLCRKGDYYRYLAEFSSGAERKEAADQSLEAYKVIGFVFAFPLICELGKKKKKLIDMFVFWSVGCCCCCRDWFGTNTSSETWLGIELFCLLL